MRLIHHVLVLFMLLVLWTGFLPGQSVEVEDGSWTWSDGAPVIHVAPSGDDGWSGRRSEAAPDLRDGPLRTMAQALTWWRQQGRSLPSGAIIELHAGLPPLEQGLHLAAVDSGRPGARLWIRGHPGEAACLSGGQDVRNLLHPLDADTLPGRVPAAVRNHVRELDLSTAHLQPGTFHPFGYGYAFQPAMVELYWNGLRLPQASWPKSGASATIADLPNVEGHQNAKIPHFGSLTAGYVYTDERMAAWSTPQEIQASGFWRWDWACTTVHLSAIDPVRRLVHLAPGSRIEGFKVGQRVQYRNIIEELSEPGEWVLDGPANRILVLPPGDVTGSQVVATRLEEPLITLDQASDIRISDLEIAFGRGHGVRIRGGHDVRIEHCACTHLGGTGILVEGGTDHHVAGNVVHDTGHGGIDLYGGIRKTLAPSGHAALGNEVYDIARRTRCYAPAIGAHGVGMRIANNLMHDLPHVAVLFSGNEISVERNEIHQVCLETGDAGAIYTGRDFSFRGNRIRSNFIHHLGGVGMGTMGMYNDDCVSGTSMEGNVFWKVRRAVFLGGGRDFLVDNNLFVDCDPAIELDARGLDPGPPWNIMVGKIMYERLVAMDWLRPPFSTRYPELAALEPFFAAGAGVPPGNIRIRRNLCVGGRWLVTHWGAKPEMVAQEGNYTGPDPGFVDPVHGDFHLKPGAALPISGFAPIPFEEIGLAGYRPGPR